MLFRSFWKKISGYDIVLDCVGGRTEGKSMKILKPGGRQITISGFPDIATAKTMKKPPLFLLIMYLLNTKRQMRQKKYKVHFSFLLAKENGRDLSKIVDLADSGNIKPVIDRVFSIDDAPSAIEYVKTNRAKGKVVVEVGI